MHSAQRIRIRVRVSLGVFAHLFERALERLAQLGHERVLVLVGRGLR
jgi:hypothetical protein